MNASEEQFTLTAKCQVAKKDHFITIASERLMNPLKLESLLVLTLFSSLCAEESHFFRISSPVTTTFAAVSAGGYVTWTNAATNVVFTIQTAPSLQSQTNWVDYVQVPSTNPVTTHRIFDPNPPTGMVLIPSGSFTMGDTFNEGLLDELPTHTVYVSEFFMDMYEVSKALWDEVKTWATLHGYSFDNAGAGIAAKHPVYSVSWYDVVKWCNARSEKEGRVPAYYTDLSQTMVYRSGQVDVQNTWVKWDSGYRLPTEAEWEKAARGGLSGKRFPWGDTITHSQANYNSSSDYVYDISSTRGLHPDYQSVGYPYTSPVGSFPAGISGYGLYDMAGNVAEWCWDWYATSYDASSPVDDPRGPTSGSHRVFRNGCQLNAAWLCRVAYHGRLWPVHAFPSTGFRSVLAPSQ